VQAARTVTQAARLANANTLFVGSLRLNVSQSARLANTNTLFAGTISTPRTLTQTARLSNANVLFAGRIDLRITQPARLTNPNTLFNGVVTASIPITQAARLNNASVVYVGLVASGSVLIQLARLNNVNTFYPALVYKKTTYQTLREWFDANWVSTAKRFENESQDPPANLDPWVFFETFGDFYDAAEVTGNHRSSGWRVEGVANFHVVVSSGIGTTLARGYAEDLVTMLQGLTLPGGIRIERLSIGDNVQLESDGSYFSIPVAADWAREL
jgi:hypothetical protein